MLTVSMLGLILSLTGSYTFFFFFLTRVSGTGIVFYRAMGARAAAAGRGRVIALSHIAPGQRSPSLMHIAPGQRSPILMHIAPGQRSPILMHIAPGQHI